MTTKLDKLIAQRVGLDAQIKAAKAAQKGERRAVALRLLESAGWLELEESELQNRIAAHGAGGANPVPAGNVAGGPQ